MLANTMQVEGGASAQAVRDKLRAARRRSRTVGSVVAARCAAVLYFLSRVASEDGRALRLAVDDVLDLVVRATADRPRKRSAPSR